jgi:hypothetical protein
MTITQTVEIPDSRRLIIDVPREVPTGPGAETALKSADEETSPHPNSDALFALLSPICGTVNVDEIRDERLAKHLC